MRLFVLSIALVLGWTAMAGAQGPITVTTKPVDGIAGTTLFAVDRFNPVVNGLPTIATFSERSLSGGVCRSSAYTASVDWGSRGQGSFAQIRFHSKDPGGPGPGACTYDVLGNYLYYRPGAYGYTVRVCREGGPCADPVGRTAAIRAPRFTAMRLDAGATAGVSFEAALAVFRDNNRFGTPDQFKTMIDWGDQTPATPGRLAGVPGAWAVIGGHTFQTAGRHDVRIDIQRSTTTPPAARLTDLSKTLTLGGEPVFPASVALASVTSHVTVQGGARPRRQVAQSVPMRIVVPDHPSAGSVQRDGLGIRLLDAPAELQYGLVVELLRRDGTRVARTVLGLPPHAGRASLALRWRLAAGVRLRRGEYVLRIPSRPGFAEAATPLTLRR